MFPYLSEIKQYFGSVNDLLKSDFLNDTFLADTISLESYHEQRKNRSACTGQVVRSVISNVKFFCQDQAGTDFIEILKSLKQDNDSTRNVNRSMVFFQKFVNWLAESHPHLKVMMNQHGYQGSLRAKDVTSIVNYVSQLRQIFEKVGGIEISASKLNGYLIYPALGEKEEAEPLTHDEFRNILNHIKEPRRKMLYLIKKDTCSRIRAMVQLKLENFDTTVRPIRVTFPAHIMKRNKRGESKTVVKYVIQENESGLLQYLKGFTDPRAIVFGCNPNPMSAVGNEEKYWNRLVKRLGYTDVYRHNGRLKKNIHSIKAFTETQAEEAVNKFYADAYGDHSSYLKQYIRWKEDKKIAKFRLMEPLLNLYTKIEKVETNPELKVENDQLR